MSSVLLVLCSRAPDPDPLLQLCALEHVLGMVSLICGIGVELMELWTVRPWKVGIAVQVLSGSSFKKLLQQEMLIISYDWDMAAVPIHCISRSIPCQLIVVLLTKFAMSYSSLKTRFLLFCPGCTPEWTTLLLLRPGTLLVWLCEHTGTTFNRQHSHWVLIFLWGKKFFCNWGHRLLCTATVWEYKPGVTFRHQSIFWKQCNFSKKSAADTSGLFLWVSLVGLNNVTTGHSHVSEFRSKSNIFIQSILRTVLLRMCLLKTAALFCGVFLWPKW